MYIVINVPVNPNWLSFSSVFILVSTNNWRKRSGSLAANGHQLLTDFVCLLFSAEQVVQIQLPAAAGNLGWWERWDWKSWKTL